MKRFFNRDISWLAFNERVLDEANSEMVPLMERVNFLSIYSSNLDEFYRVRVPAIQEKIRSGHDSGWTGILEEIDDIVKTQLDKFGAILTTQLIPQLQEAGILFHYFSELPSSLMFPINSYFDTSVAGLIEYHLLDPDENFFAANNQLYTMVIVADKNGQEALWMVQIPTSRISRFYQLTQEDKLHIIFLEDVIRLNLPKLFPGLKIIGAYNIKLTRDASLEFNEDYAEGSFEYLEEQLKQRERGSASRILFEPGFPLRYLKQLVLVLNLRKASLIEGGKHHNLKDLSKLPVDCASLFYPKWPPLPALTQHCRNLFEHVTKEDILIHTPYHSYDIVLRFFNEAAIDPNVSEIYTTLYRVASDSKIVNALITAARNGKRVSVVVELKARFDEANNIHWSKQMKLAGVKLIHTEKILKVHAKAALIKRHADSTSFFALLATGNLNEGTARVYTDHILLTAHQAMATELLNLFDFLASVKRKGENGHIEFAHLLVSRFNLQRRFLDLIDREINFARNGFRAGITVKVNNLEEETMIEKLYEASNAGVRVQLLVRGVCRLVPGVHGQSSNITVRRIVDRYLEHGRVFIFHNSGNKEVYLGSADWMGRNIFRRIEVCFPIFDNRLKRELQKLIDLQFDDDTQAREIDSCLRNVPVKKGKGIRSQQQIYRYLAHERRTPTHE